MRIGIGTAFLLTAVWMANYARRAWLKPAFDFEPQIWWLYGERTWRNLVRAMPWARGTFALMLLMVAEIQYFPNGQFILQVGALCAGVSCTNFLLFTAFGRPKFLVSRRF